MLLLAWGSHGRTPALGWHLWPHPDPRSLLPRGRGTSPQVRPTACPEHSGSSPPCIKESGGGVWGEESPWLSVSAYAWEGRCVSKPMVPCSAIQPLPVIKPIGMLSRCLTLVSASQGWEMLFISSQTQQVLSPLLTGKAAMELKRLARLTQLVNKWAMIWIQPPDF